MRHSFLVENASYSEKKLETIQRAQAKTALADPVDRPLKAKEFAENLNDSFWYNRKVSEGTKDPVEYEFAKRRVVLSGEGLSHRAVWLIIRRTLGEKKEYSFFLSNAPVSSWLKLFVWLSGMRWPIEQCFEEMKTKLGFDQYEVRKFTGWHHHVLMTTLAHFFLWHTKTRLGGKLRLLRCLRLEIFWKVFRFSTKMTCKKDLV